MAKGSSAVACVVALLAFLSSCSNNAENKCPQCPAGQVCDQTSKVCVPQQCPAAGCGANATCRTDGVCGCQQGWSDCNRDLGAAGGNGCECNKGCATTQCGAAACSPSTASSCGSTVSYCSGGSCTPCAAGAYNCDGLYDCEASQPCRSSGCSPTVAASCGTSGQYCAGGSCTACPTGKYNCDGLADCESSQACGPPSGCLEECTGFQEYLCVKDPADNRCEDCLDSSHCKSNPRSNGPTCDTSDLAGTGFNFCICASDAECATSTVGRVCKAAEGTNPKLKTCTCNADADCPAPYTICEGMLFKRCQKPCTSDADCKRGISTGFCETATGKCSFPEY